jgi:hypothetical protein
MLAINHARKIHEWYIKFYPTTTTIANKCKCNSTVRYNYNSRVTYRPVYVNNSHVSYVLKHRRGLETTLLV